MSDDERAKITNVSTIMEDIRRRGERGTTAEEASYRLSVQPSSYTGRRSELHRRGAVERLADKRDGQHVYVLPEFVGGRATAPYVPHRGPASPEVEAALHDLERWISTTDVGHEIDDALHVLLDHVRQDL